MTLTPASRQKYSRHLNLPDFTEESQERLSNARIVVVGAGGLGCPALQYLTAAGVGNITVVDGDLVSRSNLQRQILYGEKDVGKQKTDVALRSLKTINQDVKLLGIKKYLNSSNALDVLKDCDLVLDGTDNLPSRYLLNDACYLLKKPLIYGSVYQYEGQVSVFHHHNGPNYRDLFPTPPSPHLVPDCASGGVLGTLPGIIGTMQAMEAIKVITGIGKTLSGRLALFDARDFSWRQLNITKDPANPVSGDHPSIRELIDYDAFCGQPAGIPEMDAMELRQRLIKEEALILLDVREESERLAGHLGGLHIPLDRLIKELDRLPRETDIVVYCQGGQRSRRAVELLRRHGRISRVWSLKNGYLGFEQGASS